MSPEAPRFVSAGLLRAALFFAGVLLLFPLQALADAKRGKLPSSLLYTPDRRLMKVVACGHGPTVADLVWIQSTSYVISEFRSGRTHIDHLHALYDVMTDLDPDFVDAYVTGAVFLSSIADQPERSLELLEKGHGRLEERAGAIAAVTSGRIHPANRDRWKPLGEMAATHVVSLAGFAPTLEERYQEINLGGKLYVWGTKRYPVAAYPERPGWWETLAPGLVQRREKASSRAAWYQAVLTVWNQRLHFTPRESPLHALYERRMNEIRARQTFEDLATGFAQWKRAHGAPPRSLEELVAAANAKVPADPLGVGWFIVQGELVAPALDAALLERKIARAAAEFRRRNDRAPRSLDELATPAAPPWVVVTWDGTAGTARVQGVPPR